MQKFGILEIFDQLTRFNNFGVMVTNNKVKQTKIGGRFKSTRRFSIYNATFIIFTLRKKFLSNINKTIHLIVTVTLKNFVGLPQL